MKYNIKLSNEVEAIQNTTDKTAVINWLKKHDTSGGYYRVSSNSRNIDNNNETIYIDITESVESIVPENAYIILRDVPTRYSKFRWHSEDTFNNFYSIT